MQAVKVEPLDDSGKWQFQEALAKHEEVLLRAPEIPQLIVCGGKLEAPEGTLRGHGLIRTANEDIESTLSGFVRTVNRLIYIESLHSKYSAEAGDVVIGRVRSIEEGKWLLDVGSLVPATLALTAISLPSGEQRRKTEAESVDMRQFFVEDDLLVTEVQKVNLDGSTMLHTRNARYGRLASGCCVCVPPSLMVRLCQHMITLQPEESAGAPVFAILGMNGYIWFGSAPKVALTDTFNFVQVDQTDGNKYEPVTLRTRRNIARLKNCTTWLARNYIKICPDTIMAVCRATRDLGIPISQIVQPEHQTKIFKHCLGVSDPPKALEKTVKPEKEVWTDPPLGRQSQTS